MHDVIASYQQMMDNAEKKRIKDTAKNRLTELLTGYQQFLASLKKEKEAKEAAKKEKEAR